MVGRMMQGHLRISLSDYIFHKTLAWVGWLVRAPPPLADSTYLGVLRKGSMLLGSSSELSLVMGWWEKRRSPDGVQSCRQISFSANKEKQVVTCTRWYRLQKTHVNQSLCLVFDTPLLRCVSSSNVVVDTKILRGSVAEESCTPDQPHGTLVL